ncbi:MAG: hypothetical protein HOM25_12645 [Rhodospirillaceae bacterium]|jgi:hypothetical protein|nr:hypothetical protein [Rhodospirillaceae bacterium]MBT5665030.1 hypothetical protein [Rhodospirillaceae bacterium]MBT5809392.1 hypothetical protein [Rhodospirillaceae bacterium]
MVDPGTSKSFVVRIWLEGEPGTNPEWRGHVQHVQGEEDQYFRNLSELREFIERISHVPLPVGDQAQPNG